MKKELSKEQMELHERVVESFEQSWNAEIEQAFCEGFKLGILIGIECMTQ